MKVLTLSAGGEKREKGVKGVKGAKSVLACLFNREGGLGPGSRTRATPRAPLWVDALPGRVECQIRSA